MTMFADRFAGFLRLVVLQVLAAAAKEGVPDVNDAILRSAVCEFGPAPDIERLNEALSWLAGKKLVTLRKAGTFTVAALTDQGADVAAGRVTMDGVRRPSPQADA